MKLQQLITGIRAAQNTTKTAAEASTEAAAKPVETAPAPAQTKLSSALREAVAESTKVAAAAPATASAPVEGVMKVAQELAESEKLAALNEAKMLGIAYADAAIARFAEWQKSAASLPTVQAVPGGVSKVASVQPQADETFQKFAEENPMLARQAIAYGYAPTADGLQKMAEDSYVQGYNDQVAEIHKTAAEEFLKAAAVTSVIIEQSAQK